MQYSVHSYRASWRPNQINHPPRRSPMFLILSLPPTLLLSLKPTPSLLLPTLRGDEFNHLFGPLVFGIKLDDSFETAKGDVVVA